MKKRAFFTTLLLFLFFFHGAILTVSIVALKDRMQVQAGRCLAEHYVIAASLLQDIQAVEARGIDPATGMEELMLPYLRAMRGQRADFAVYRDGALLFTTGRYDDATLPFDPGWAETDTARHLAVIRGEHPFLYVAGVLPQPAQRYALVYRYELSELLAGWRGLRNLLFTAGGVFSAVLALCLLAMLNRVFRPLAQVAEASRSIAAGDFAGRLNVSGRDELFDLAESFNHMAREIEGRIAALEEAAEQKEQFINSFAHELRTPLTAIYGYAQYLQRAAVSEEDRYSATEYILSECRRLQNMSCQLLNLAMMRRDEIPMGEIPAASLLEAVQNSLRERAQDRQVALSCRCGLESVWGNRELLESLLVNLVDNALKACEPGGEIVVSAGRGAAGPVLSVRDNGRGMTEEQLRHVTEAFYRADPSRSRREGGAGLGLALCKQIATLHGAALQFFSSPGEGTEVFVHFTT